MSTDNLLRSDTHGNNVRRTTLISFAVVVVALFSVGMIAYFQVRGMYKRLERLASPLQYQVAKSELLADLLEAELALRNYAATRDYNGKPDRQLIAALTTKEAQLTAKITLMRGLFPKKEGEIAEVEEMLRRKYVRQKEVAEIIRIQRTADERQLLRVLTDSLRSQLVRAQVFSPKLDQAIAQWRVKADSTIQRRRVSWRYNEKRMEDMVAYEVDATHSLGEFLVTAGNRASIQTAVAQAAEDMQRAKSAQDWIFLSMILIMIGALLLLWRLDRILLANRALYRSLQEAKAVAESLARAKEDFLANMSHEIRTPMFAVTGFADRLAVTKLSRSQRSLLEPLQRAATYLKDLLNDILDYSKIEAGHLQPERIAFRSRRVLEDVQQTFGLRTSEKGLYLNIETGPDLPPVLVGDPTRLRQMLFNLTGNAVKFTEKGGITVRAAILPQANDGLCWVAFSVADTGIGIAADKLDRIFDVFIQAEASTARKYGGTGLGLAITRELARVLGGTIDVRSEVGIGTTFTLRLPFAVGAVSDLAAEHEPPEAGDRPLEGMQFLLADDALFNRLLISGMLKDWGATVHEVEDGEGVLRAVEANPGFDCVLMDLQMPDMDGIEATRELRRRYGTDLPVIALTATSTAGDLSRARQAGVDAHLIKPFRQADLLHLLAERLKLSGIQSETPAAMLPESHENDVLDLSKLRAMVGGRPEALRRLLQAFVDSAARNLPALEAAIAAGNPADAAAYAHKMVPACRHLGLDGVVRDLKFIEEEQTAELGVLQQHMRTAVDTIRRNLPQIEAEIDLLATVSDGGGT
ncbi:MAG: hypothetical protein OHK0039_25970 [Bacteroidia bacterium]